MSRSSRVVRGVRSPSRWMREVQVVLFWNTEMASLSVVLGSSVQRLDCLHSRPVEEPQWSSVRHGQARAGS
jgi:hypothetical protein